MTQKTIKTVRVKNTSGFPLPAYETMLSAGMDLRSNQYAHLQPGERCIVKTGLFIELPEGYEAQVRPRSGLAAKYGITVLNSPGTIDADYRGEIGVILVNLSKQLFPVKPGDRIAQLVVAEFTTIEWEDIDDQDLEETSRGDKGFGSTGTN
jgi:dUTP pyrophosphatase